MNSQSKSPYQIRRKPVGPVHTIIWAIAGIVFLLISIAGTITVIQFLIENFRDLIKIYAGKNFSEDLLLIGFIAIFGFSGYGLIQGGIKASDEKKEFENANTISDAKVLKRYKKQTRPDNPYLDTVTRVSWYIVVKFETKSGPLTLKAEVSKKLYDQISVNETISVKYANSDPKTALLEGEF